MSDSTKKNKKLKIFLTGYLGFQGIQQNPTELLVKEIFNQKEKFTKENIELADFKIFTVTTDYVDKNIHLIYDQINQEEKDTIFLIVHFGLYADSKIPQIETKAVNFIHDEYKKQIICDKDGKCFLTKLNAENIVDDLNKTADCPNCKVSCDAGTYLCNYIYYTSLKKYQNAENVLVTFIHIPLFETFSMENDLNLFGKFLDNVSKKYL